MELNEKWKLTTQNNAYLWEGNQISKQNRYPCFWGPFNQFFSCGHLHYVPHEQFWRENFQKFLSWGVTWWNFSFLRGLYLIGQGQTVNVQYDPCNGYGQSFPKWYDTWWSAKNWGFQAIFKILESFFSNFYQHSKTPWRGPLLRYLDPLKCILGYV